MRGQIPPMPLNSMLKMIEDYESRLDCKLLMGKKKEKVLNCFSKSKHICHPVMPYTYTDPRTAARQVIRES